MEEQPTPGPNKLDKVEKIDLWIPDPARYRRTSEEMDYIDSIIGPALAKI